MNGKKIKVLAEAFRDEVVKLRHQFHRHPETAWKEVETSKKIESLLREWGFENIRRGVRGTPCGVMADINPGREGPSIALRADMDALAIKEENCVPYVSESEGVMHACGHDSHMAILLGAARVLSSIKDDLPGRVRLIFQPAEEGGATSDNLPRSGVHDPGRCTGGYGRDSRTPYLVASRNWPRCRPARPPHERLRQLDSEDLRERRPRRHAPGRH